MEEKSDDRYGSKREVRQLLTKRKKPVTTDSPDEIQYETGKIHDQKFWLKRRDRQVGCI